MSEERQYKTIELLRKEIHSEVDRTNFIQKIILINQMLNDTLVSSANLQKIYNDIMTVALANITCEEILKFKEGKDIDSIFASAYLYFYLSMNEELIQAESFVDIMKIQKCLAQMGNEILRNKTNSRKEDFVNTLAVISSKMINSLYNKTFFDPNFKSSKFQTEVQKYKQSIVKSDTRKEILNTVEQIALLELSIKEKSYSKYKSIKLFNSKFKF